MMLVQSSSKRPVLWLEIGTNVINMKQKSKSPRMDPCGTLDETGDQSDEQPFTTTLCLLDTRNAWIHLRRLPLTSMQSILTSCVTLEKSRNSTCELDRLSRVLAHWCTISSNWGWNECPLLKPCWDRLGLLCWLKSSSWSSHAPNAPWSSTQCW